MIKAVIFDFYGVVAEDGWLPVKRRYIGDNDHLAVEVADLGKQNELGLISNSRYYAQVAELLGTNEDQLRNALGKYVLNTELLDFIATQLRPRYKVGLLSNANHDIAKESFSSRQRDLFDVVVTSFAEKLIKPDPRMYQLAAQRLGTTPGECLMVDDIERYCSSAQEVGMQTLLWTDQQSGITALTQLLLA